jgi:hypothetical protein
MELFFSLQADQGGAPAAGSFIRKLEGFNIWQFFQGGMDDTAKGARPFPMNYPDFHYTLFQTGVKIVGNQPFYLPWLKGVQIKGAINGKLYGVGKFHRGSSLHEAKIPTWPEL